MSPHVLGLDLGLARAGAAQIHQDQRIITWPYGSDPPEATAEPAVTARRIRDVVAWAIGRATTATALAVIEAMPYSIGAHGSRDERAAIIWAVAGQLDRLGVPVALINPVSLKAKIAGSGNADKTDMRRALVALYPSRGLARASYDEVDAAALATLGVIKLAAHHGPAGPWKGPWLDARALNIDTGCRWPNLGPGWIKPQPAPLLPQFAVPS